MIKNFHPIYLWFSKNSIGVYSTQYLQLSTIVVDTIITNIIATTLPIYLMLTNIVGVC